MHALEEGQKVTFQIQIDREAFIGIWTIDASEKIRQIFPNRYEPNYRLKAGKPRTIPGSDTAIKKYRINATVSPGAEWVWVFASTEPWNELKGREQGPFLVFENAEERQYAKERLRGLELELAAADVAEKLLPYRVSPRPSPDEGQGSPGDP
jgi:hypothetical protein